MTKKARRNNKPGDSMASSPGRNVFLMLTLVPLVVGVIFIGAWALDMSIVEDPQSQVIIGILFILLSFAASNALQKRWRLAAGWGLLMLSDLVLLVWLELWAQIVAIVLGLVGLAFLAMEFYTQYQQGKLEKARK